MPSPQPLAGQVPYPPPASFAATTTAPPRPCSRRGRLPKRALRAWNAHTTALFAYGCQSFLDNFSAGWGQLVAMERSARRHTCVAAPLTAALVLRFTGDCPGFLRW